MLAVLRAVDGNLHLVNENMLKNVSLGTCLSMVLDCPLPMIL